MAQQKGHRLDHSILDKYLNLPQGGKIQAEYIWIGGSGQDLRCKTRVCTAIILLSNNSFFISHNTSVELSLIDIRRH